MSYSLSLRQNIISLHESNSLPNIYIPPFTNKNCISKCSQCWWFQCSFLHWSIRKLMQVHIMNSEELHLYVYYQITPDKWCMIFISELARESVTKDLMWVSPFRLLLLNNACCLQSYNTLFSLFRSIFFWSKQDRSICLQLKSRMANHKQSGKDATVFLSWDNCTHYKTMQEVVVKPHF